MEKVSRRCSKVLKFKKECKMVKKEQKNNKKSNNEEFFTGFEKKKRSLLNSRGLQKITTNKLTLKTKPLVNAIRSAVAVKESIIFEEEANALINEDLFKTIELSNKNNNIEETSNEKAPVLNSLSTNFTPQEEISSNKSIFREIEEKYQHLNNNKSLKPVSNEPYLISDKNLKNILSKRLTDTKNAPPDHFSKLFRNFLHTIRANDLQNLLVSRIVSNQSKINECSVLYNLNSKYPNNSISESNFRRKFARNCNDLIKSQNLGAKYILLSQTEDLMSKASLNDKINMDKTELRPKFTSPTKSSSRKTEFPPGSYRTPESQRLNIREFESMSTKLCPAIRTPFPPFVIELNEENCGNSRLMDMHGIPREKQSELLTQTKTLKKNLPFDAAAIFERPKKVPRTELVDRRIPPDLETSPRTAFADLSPPPPIPSRKLSFSERFDDSVENDFHLLEDIKNLQMASEFDLQMSVDDSKENYKPEFVCSTPKRSITSIFENDSSSDDDDGIDHRAKRFAGTKFDMGPIPKVESTPEFKFHPRLPN